MELAGTSLAIAENCCTFAAKSHDEERVVSEAIGAGDAGGRLFLKLIPDGYKLLHEEFSERDIKTFRALSKM